MRSNLSLLRLQPLLVSPIEAGNVSPKSHRRTFSASTTQSRRILDGVGAKLADSLGFSSFTGFKKSNDYTIQKSDSPDSNRPFSESPKPTDWKLNQRRG